MFVDGTNGNDAYSGRNWTYAKKTIQAAIDAVNINEEIEVAQGTYPEAINFLGKAIRLYSSGGPNVTTINGSGHYHVVQCVSGEGPDTVLEGFTITGGNANGTGVDLGGGGMLNDSSSPTVTNCIFTANAAENGGGMLNNNYSSPTVTNCIFTSNTAYRGGGMLNDQNSHPTVTNCIFTSNTGEYGGGLYNAYYSNSTVTNCTFEDNNAPYFGGGMDNAHGSNPTVTNCTFTGNTAGSGGGMFNEDYSSPNVTNCTFTGNTAGSGGGMYNKDDSSPNVTNCTFTSNRGNFGGGMHNEGKSSPTVTNSTFTGNTAGSGGGMNIISNSSPTVANCIFWANTPNEITVLDSNPSITYSDLQGGWSGTGTDNIDAEPLFVDASGGDFRLTWGSPCKDAGDNAAVPAGITTDFEGEQRIFNATVDMGADEFVDSESDHLPDSWEIQKFGSILAINGLSDDDGDGWTNAAEFQFGSDPTDPNDRPLLTTIYVGGTAASDANLGSENFPLQSLHEAVARINSLPEAAYTINLTAGVYSLPLESDTSLAPVHNVTINGAGATINGSGASSWITGLTIPAGVADVRINGLTIQGFARGIAVNSDGGCVSLAGVAINDCDTGIQLVEAYQVDVDLSGSTISSCTTGIKLAGGSSNNAIHNGLITENFDGVRVEGDTEAPDDNRFENLRISDNNGNGIVIFDGTGNHVVDCEITGNNISETAFGGVVVLSACNDVAGSIIEGNHCFGVWADDLLSMTPVDAGGNWWGDVSGPAGVGSGTGDAVSEYVNFVPWAGAAPNDDTDLDGLSDTWEQQIISADSGDGITSLADVRPQDDFDGDGWTNAAEFQFGSDPTDPNDRPLLITIYVGGTGASDANLGSENFPLLSLHEAVRRINSLPEADYTINLTPGVYGLLLESDTSLTPVHNVTINGAGATINGSGASLWAAGLTIPAGVADVRINGLTIQNFAQGIAINSDGGCVSLAGVAINACDTGIQLVEAYQVDVDLSGSAITSCTTGIKVAGGSSNNVIRNGAVTANFDGIRVEGDTEAPDDNRFESILVSNNNGNGIVIYDGTGNHVIDCEITGNNISETAYGGIAILSACNNVTGSIIEGNHCFGVWASDLLSMTPVDAAGNWWGDVSGPAGVGPGTGDPVGEYVNFVPWAGATPGDDTDLDGLSDTWEQQIINANTGDDITSLADVRPQDDFDGDGWTNADQCSGIPVWFRSHRPGRPAAFHYLLRRWNGCKRCQSGQRKLPPAIAPRGDRPDQYDGGSGLHNPHGGRYLRFECRIRPAAHAGSQCFHNRIRSPAEWHGPGRHRRFRMDRGIDHTTGFGKGSGTECAGTAF